MNCPAFPKKSEKSWQGFTPVSGEKGKDKDSTEPTTMKNKNLRFLIVAAAILWSSNSVNADCVATPSGLVSWWAGEGNAVDSIGNNSGVIQGGVTFSSGEAGEAFNLSGNNQYIRIPNSSVLTPTDSFSIDAWIYPTVDGALIIFSKWGDMDDYASQRSYNFQTDTNRRLTFGISDDAHQNDSSFHTFSTPPNAIELNAWNHVAAVYDRSTGTRTIYVNGNVQASRTDAPITITHGAADVAIGAVQRSSTLAQFFFQGSIDELDFFNRALSPTEIQSIYAAGPSGKCNGAPLAPVTSFSARGPFSDAGPITFLATGPAHVKMRVQFSTDSNIKTDGNESSWADLLDGGVMSEDPNNPGNYGLVSAAYPAGSGIYFRAVASKPGYGDSVLPAAAYLGPYTLHAQAGLSATGFTVNGGTTSIPGVADTVLRFAASQSARPAGLRVRVQASTDGSTWSDLAANNGGTMIYDTASAQFVLNTNNYPTSGAVSFRAISSAKGFADTISNAVGPFNLASTRTHLNPVDMSLATNGWFADFYFVARIKSLPAGGTVRIQSSTTPLDENSWSDLNDGNSGHMLSQNVTDQYYLIANTLAAATNVYFRAVASVPGALDSFSVATGPVNIQAVTPAEVAISGSGAGFISGSGTGAANNRILAHSGQVSFHVTATLKDSNRTIKELGLLIDGELKNSIAGNNLDYTTSTLAPGDHTISAFAIDDLGVYARVTSTDSNNAPRTTSAGAFLEPFYIRVLQPGDDAVKTAHSSGRSIAAASAAGKTFKAVRDGHWATASTWADNSGAAGIPGANDTVIIEDHEVDIDSNQGDPENIVITSVTVDGGQTGGIHAITPCSVTVSGVMTIVSGNFNGPLDLVIQPGAILEAINRTPVFFNSLGANEVRIINSGKLNLHGSGGFAGLDTLQNDANLTWDLPVTIPPNAGANPSAGARLVLADSLKLGAKISNGVVTPAGIVTVAGHVISQNASNIVSTNGNNAVPKSVMVVSHDGGSIITTNNSDVISNDGSTLLSDNGIGLISNDGSSLISNDGSSIVAQGGGNFVGNNGSASIKANKPAQQTAEAPIQITGGEISLSAFSIIGDVVMDGGILTGSGLIQGNLSNNGGYIMPGGPNAGTIGITGSFTQGSNGTLLIDDGGGLPMQFDQLQVAGTANLAGKLDVKLINGYEPGAGDVDNPIGYSAATGTFSSISSNAQIAVNPTGATTTVDPSKPQPTNGQPVNIATRLQIQGGDNVLVAGFIITGPSGSSKKILIRGLGPSLANLGVPGAIADPLLELHAPDGSTVVNDNWQQAPNAADMPPAFAPSNSLESAIYTTLSPGTYTAVLKGAHGETGIGLVEVYDFDTASVAKLANIATRGFVDRGDSVMIGGFIVGGTEPAKMLVRAIGPSLTAFGLETALPATSLELHDANGQVISNDGWRSTQENEIEATGVAPASNDEAAILATLAPGTYTAVVRGRNDTTGIAVIEAYNLP